MAILSVHCDAPDCDGDLATVHDEECTVAISNHAGENGYPQDPGPHRWLNSARVVVDPDHDAVVFLLSVGDPRGAFRFEVRRTADGRILIHTPHPGEGMPHVRTKEHHPGTLVLVHDDGETPRDFSDPEPDDDDDDDDDDA